MHKDRGFKENILGAHYQQFMVLLIQNMKIINSVKIYKNLILTYQNLHLKDFMVIKNAEKSLIANAVSHYKGKQKIE